MFEEQDAHYWSGSIPKEEAIRINESPLLAGSAKNYDAVDSGALSIHWFQKLYDLQLELLPKLLDQELYISDW